MIIFVLRSFPHYCVCVCLCVLLICFYFLRSSRVTDLLLFVGGIKCISFSISLHHRPLLGHSFSYELTRIPATRHIPQWLFGIDLISIRKKISITPNTANKINYHFVVVYHVMLFFSPFLLLVLCFERTANWINHIFCIASLQQVVCCCWCCCLYSATSLSLLISFLMRFRKC